MRAILRGVFWYARLCIGHAYRGRTAYAVSIAGSCGLVFIVLGMQMKVSMTASSCRAGSLCADLAARDLVVLGVFVSIVQAAFVTTRVSLERQTESSVFDTMGISSWALLLARFVEFWFVGFLSGIGGVVISGLGLWAIGAFNVSKTLMFALISACIIPTLALAPWVLWSSVSLRRRGRNV